MQRRIENRRDEPEVSIIALWLCAYGLLTQLEREYFEGEYVALGWGGDLWLIEGKSSIGKSHVISLRTKFCTQKAPVTAEVKTA